MAAASRRFSHKRRAALVGGITLSIWVGVAVLGWFVGWNTVDEYSTGLRIAGVVAVVVGLASLAGNQTRGADAQFGAASLEMAHLQTRGQPDYYHDVKWSFAFLLMMSLVGILVMGGGFALQLLFG